MTTRSDPYAIPYVKPRTSGFRWRRLAFSFVLTLAAIVAFAASFAVGYARVHQGSVLPGVEVAGVPLGGLSRSEAETELRESLPSLSSGDLVISVGSTQQTIPYSSFERDYNLDYMLDSAFALGRNPDFVQQIQEQLRILVNGVAVGPQVTWNNDALAMQVAAIAQAAQRDPISASIQRVDGRYVVSPSSDGLSVDVAGAVADAVTAVNNTSPADSAISVHTAVVPPVVSTEHAQAAVDMVERVVGASMTVSAEDLSTEIPSDVLRGWVHLDETAAGGDWNLTVERSPIEQFVNNYALQTNVQPTNATFTFVSGTDVQVVPSVEGRATDVETTTNNIMNALQERATGGSDPTQVALALAPVAPALTTSDARAIASRVTKIGEWTTKFTPSALNGEGVNIQIPTSIINGYVVEPGQLFDFLGVIGPITSPPYTAGAAIVHGHTVLDGVLGGGMCSCSTTLFNAAMRAGLDIKARRNHAYYISRYPVGLDATVWIASANSKQTMSFVNDLEYPILIKGINKTGEVTFELYGVPDGRTVQLSDPVVENQKTANDYYQYTNDLKPGQQNRVEFQVDGFDSTVVRTVRDSAGNVIHEDTFKSKYKTIDGLVLVGRYAGDPPAGTKVLASVWKAQH